MSEERIFIERNSPSDEDFLVHKIFVSNGDFVKKDTLLAEVEGAKAVFEIYSEKEGYFFTKFQPGDYINIDTSFAVLSDNNEFIDKNDSGKKKDTIHVYLGGQQFVLPGSNTSQRARFFYGIIAQRNRLYQMVFFWRKMHGFQPMGKVK